MPRMTRENANEMWRVGITYVYPDGTRRGTFWHGPFVRRNEATAAVTADQKSLNRRNIRERIQARANGQIYQDIILETNFQKGTIVWETVE